MSALPPAVEINEPESERSWESWRASPWTKFIVRRLISVVWLLAILILLTFLIVHLVPGDPARNIVGVNASAEQVQAVREQLGLTQPLWVQFASYLGRLAHLDLGQSYVTGAPVSVMLRQRLPVTAELAGLAVLIVIVLGFPAGIASAAQQRTGRAKWASVAFTVGASLGGALPEYITGTVLIFVVALYLHLLPVQGGPGLRSIILPAVAVAFAPTAVFARLVRNETATVLGQEYITTAMSKRLPVWRLYLHHVLPNVVTSTLTLGGLLLVALLGGTVITENVFNIPGVGTEIVQAILQSDYPAVQGIIFVLGLLAIAITLAVDVVLAVLDPRTLTAARSA